MTERSTAMRAGAPPLLPLICVALAYFATGWWALQLPYLNSHASLIWPPTGVALAALLRWGPRVWPGIWIGALLASLSIGTPVLVSAAIASGGTLGPWMIARMLSRMRFDPQLERVSDIRRYVALVVVGMAFTATNGTLQLYLGGLDEVGDLGKTWLYWWLGDMVGALIVGVPLLTFSWQSLQSVLRGWRRFETAATLALLAAYGVWVFSSDLSSPSATGLLFAPLLILIVLAVRTGVFIASSAALLLSALAAAEVAAGHGGPLHGDSAHQGLLLVWAYMATLSLVTVLVTALVSELAANEQRFRTTIEYAVAGIGHVSIDGRWLLVNRKLCEILGYTQQELLNARPADLARSGDGQACAAAEQQLLRGEAASCSFEERLRRKDGTLIWVMLTIVLVRRSSREPAYFVKVYEDITARKRSEELMQLRGRISAAIGRLQSRFIRGDEVAAAFQAVLDELLISSDSTRGFVAECEAGPAPPHIVLLALADPQCPADRAPLDSGVAAARLAELAQPALRHGELQFIGDDLFGYGDEPLMIVPVLSAGEVVGVVGLAGRSGGYGAQLDELLQPLFATIGNVIGALQADRHRRATEAALRLYANVFKSSHTGIAITNADRRIIEVNGAFTNLTGYTRDEALGQSAVRVAAGRQSDLEYREMWRKVESEGYWRGEIWDRGKNGELFAELLTVSSVRDSEGRVVNYIGQFTDITQLKRHQQRLEQLAHFDPLTQLPNRVLLADRLQQMMAAARREQRMLAVCYMDLDGFKSINDALGHQSGDRLLVAVGERLRSNLRDSDTLARLGGDEFVMLLGGLESIGEVQGLLERQLKLIAEPYTIEGAPAARISASIGVAVYPIDDVDADSLLRHADQAMYAAKQAGRNCYQLFDAELDRIARRSSEVRARAELALENGEFRLYYQPQVDLRSGEVVGVEALIRWLRPDGQLMPPAEFLPMIEATDFAIRLGDWVIGEALRQVDAWTAQGLRTSVSVNLSARHLQQPDFADRVRAALQRHPAVHPAQLELEVIETAALEDLYRASMSMNDCRRLGVSFAIDDFGTGYSSLAYLKRLPAETLKIDQSFIRDMLSDSDDLAIVRGVIGLAAAFRRRVVAEGVETAEHGRRLLELGCHLAQGFGIARAMPAAELPDWVRAYQAAPLLPPRPGIEDHGYQRIAAGH